MSNVAGWKATKFLARRKDKKIWRGKVSSLHALCSISNEISRRFHFSSQFKRRIFILFLKHRSTAHCQFFLIHTQRATAQKSCRFQRAWMCDEKDQIIWGLRFEESGTFWELSRRSDTGPRIIANTFPTFFSFTLKNVWLKKWEKKVQTF